MIRLIGVLIVSVLMVFVQGRIISLDKKGEIECVACTLVVNAGEEV